MFDRRRFAETLGCGELAAALLVYSPPAERVQRIGYPHLGTAQDPNCAFSTLQRALSELGADPVSSEFVPSLVWPRGNITGMMSVPNALAPKWIELIRDAMPGIKRIAVLRNPAELPVQRSTKFTLASKLRAAQTLGLVDSQGMQIACRRGVSMIDRRRFNAIMVAVFAAWATPIRAQVPKKPIRIGLLFWASSEQRGSLELELTDGLRDQGYVEGRNLTIERRYVIGDNALVDENARQLANLKLDVIVTTCSPSTLAAKKATNSTPIVMAAVTDPVGQHLIESLSRPGGNVTGLSSQAEEVLPKMLELFASILPRPAPLIAVFVNSNNPVHLVMWQKVDELAQQMKLKVVRIDIAKSAEIPGALESPATARAGAIFVLPDDPMFYNNRVRFVTLAAKNRLPAFYWASEFVEAGGLISYGESLRATYRGAATYVDKIMKGENPGTLPVAQPTRFELAVNRKTAKDLGITLPSPIMVLADRVVE